MQCYKYMHIAYLRIHTQLFELLCPCNSLIEGVNFTHFFIVNGCYWTSAKLLKQCYKVVCGAPRRNFKVGCIPLVKTPLLKTENPPLDTKFALTSFNFQNGQCIMNTCTLSLALIGCPQYMVFETLMFNMVWRFFDIDIPI